MKQLRESIRESIRSLVVETATNLPPDVRRVVGQALDRERPGTSSCLALHMVAANVDMAGERRLPICQDTGLPTFEIKAPAGVDEMLVSEAIGEAVAEATKMGALRPNSVDSVTGKNPGNNLGVGTPVVHFEQWMSDDLEVRLLLKGGGCENVSGQYSLPCELGPLGRADRDLEGVRKCVLHAVHAAQGQGCSAGIVGVGIGGDRGSGYELAKEQLFRTLDDLNPDPTLDRLESQIVQQANTLGIGTMGFGGDVTLLACKIGAQNRLPASFFVSVAYECWALRRLGVLLDGATGAIKHWLYREDAPVVPIAPSESLPLTGHEVRLTTPLSTEAVRRLRVGDVVLLSGVIYTGRDALHHHLVTVRPELPLNGAVLYHCGPIALKEGERWTIKAAGPTTSIREEPYQADVLRHYGIKAVIGKGGMGAKTLRALQECGAVYLSAVGGAAPFYARCIEEVCGVEFLSFGVPEAMWRLRVREFPTIVTMDAHGRSLHDDVLQASAGKLGELVTA